MMNKNSAPFADATAIVAAVATLFLTSSGASGSPDVLAAHAAQAGTVQAQVSQIAHEYRIPGVGVLVQKKGQTIASLSLGDCNVDFHVAVTSACIFHLASASKIFASIAMMTLVQDGKLDLDATVASMLPQIPASWSTVTVRQIMSHTSGIPDIFSR